MSAATLFIPDCSNKLRDTKQLSDRMWEIVCTRLERAIIASHTPVTNRLPWPTYLGKFPRKTTTYVSFSSAN